MTINERLIEIAKKEIGTVESPPNSNSIKYNDWYYGRHVSGQSYKWCMAFVQWVFDEGAVPLPIKTATCFTLLEWFEKNHPERVLKDKTKARPGAIAIFTFSHTGIITSTYHNGGYDTVEGNTSSTIPGVSSSGGGVFPDFRKTAVIKGIIQFDEYDLMEAKYKVTEAEIRAAVLKCINENGNEIFTALLNAISKKAPDWAEEICQKAVDSGLFVDADGDKLMDNPNNPLLRRELAIVLDRMGLLKKGAN